MSTAAWAKSNMWVTSLNIFYNTFESTPSPGATTKHNQTYLGLQAGYIFSNNVYVGAVYNMDTIETSSAIKAKINSLGPTVGYYFENGWFVEGSYLLNATYQQYSSNSDEWNQGTGTQFDIGYIMPVGSAFHVGFQMTSRAIDFKNYNDGTTNNSNISYRLNEVYPMIKLMFIF